MQQTPTTHSPENAMPAAAAFPDRETIAGKLGALSEQDQAYLALVMENPKQDENLTAGIELYLEQATASRFLHTIKLEKAGEWLGNNAPARLQIRLTEIAKSSHHPAFAAFRTGVVRSGGLHRAYPTMR